MSATLELRDVKRSTPTPEARDVPADLAPRAHRKLVCRACAHAITDRAAAIAMQGAHDHHFVNPHGHDFHVGVFATAPGCALVGPRVEFYSWFPGLPWRIAVCAGCHAHLGWAYGAGCEFFALILDRLGEPPEA